ncbi:MAG: hypothetical protein AAGC81_17415 [Pseudomonadota bacterium]
MYLYGSTGHSRDVTSSQFFQRIVDQFGYALIVPGALDITYRGGLVDTGWTLRNGRQKTRDEVRFLKSVMSDAAQRFNLDTGKVLVMGQSRGGHLVWELACHNPEIGAAFVVHAGSYWGQMPRRCLRPVRFLHTHGLRDEIVGFQGRKDSRGRVQLNSVPNAMEVLRVTNGCQQRGRQPTSQVRNFDRYTYQNCSYGSALELMLHKGGHNYPSNWFQVVVDWFESTELKSTLGPTVSSGGASPRFQSSSSGKSNSRFKSVPKN